MSKKKQKRYPVEPPEVKAVSNEIAVYINEATQRCSVVVNGVELAGMIQHPMELVTNAADEDGRRRGHLTVRFGIDL